LYIYILILLIKFGSYRFAILHIFTYPLTLLIYCFILYAKTLSPSKMFSSIRSLVQK